MPLQPAVLAGKAAPSKPFPPTWPLGFLIGVYGVLWHLLLPLVLLFLWRRGGREPLYRRHWAERWGHRQTRLAQPVWLHAASLGEMRGAAPLVRGLLGAGFPVMLSTLTPAGRTAANSLFEAAIQDGQLELSYVPFELGWALRRWIRSVQPRAALMSEIDTWPMLLKVIRQSGVPLAMVNAQYPAQSLARDLKAWGGFRAKLFQAYELVLCKSSTHAARFEQVGCAHVVVAGETRFDLPLPPAQLAAAAQLVQQAGLATDALPSALSGVGSSGRPVLCFASAVVGEDAQFLSAIEQVQQGLKATGLPKPLVVYVPRSPQRFDDVVQLFSQAGQRVERRSHCLSAELQSLADAAVALADVDLLIGDSLGEMYFYLALSQVVVVGGSFVPQGGHNVIEPLALRKPVMVGPSTWGIEYPGVEAMAAGVLQQQPDATALAQALLTLLSDPAAYAAAAAGAEDFYKEHGGATERHLAVLTPWLKGEA